ncbi:MAG: guanylate kinase [Chloroflexi bacterium]|nr:guanylate kinase [Chloroflexota bacterium]
MPPIPLLAVLSGPSGAGKDAVVGRLRQRGLSVHVAVTATTRQPRPGEQDGVDYFFISEQEFHRLIAEGALLEWAQVYGHRYGVPRASVQTALAQGQSVLVKTDVQGAATIRRAAPETVLIFLAPPSLQALEARMRRREGQNEADIARRVAAARAEMERVSEFDYLVVNYEEELDAAVDRVYAILLAEACRVGRRAPSV